MPIRGQESPWDRGTVQGSREDPTKKGAFQPRLEGWKSEDDGKATLRGNNAYRDSELEKAL